jgi:glutamate-1-semialdehyde 2,1-aminomutase
VKPDLASWAKAIGGGAAIGAFGGRADIMDEINHGAAHQGTFNGNPTQRSPPPRWRPHQGPHPRRVRALRLRSAPGSHRACSARSTSTASRRASSTSGCKGCVTYRSEPLTNYRDFLETNTELYLASYPFMINRDVFMTPGDEEQWTLSVQHGDREIDRYVDAFATFAAELTR